MLHVDLTFEDTRIVANFEGFKWAGFVVDNPTGKTDIFIWAGEQLAAVVALAFGIGENGEYNDEVIKPLYVIAEEAIQGFKHVETRPFP